MAGTILDRYPDPEFVRDAFDHLGDYNTGSFELARADGLNEEAAPYRDPRNAAFEEQLQKWIVEKRESGKKTAPKDQKQNSGGNASIYRPIRDQFEIRVLEIHPGERNDPLKATLHHCTVEFAYERTLMVPNTTGPYFGLKTRYALSMDTEKPIFYTALSYTWGTGGFDARIECDGHFLPITMSLETALRHFRRRDHSIIMWIDQICIDQSNDEEKKQQIPLMSKIYSRALNTAIWLGEGIDRRRNKEQSSGEDLESTGEDDVDGIVMAFDLLKQIRINLQFNDDNVNPTDLQRLLLPAETAEAWTMLRLLFDRPWFQRLWVIQEAILSDSPWIVCGTHQWTDAPTLTTMPFDEFTNACSTVVRSGISRLTALYGDGEASGCRMVLDLSIQREHFHQLEANLGLMETLIPTRYAQCYFPHDKVYGLLGVCNQRSITVDYKRDARELYRELAIMFLQDAIADLEHMKKVTQSADLRVARFSVFDVLLCVDHEPEEGMPSWVPDWKRSRVTESLGHSTSTLAFYEAGGRGDPNLVISADGREITLAGKVFDVIGELTPVFSEPHFGLPRSTDRHNDLLTCLELVRKCYPCTGKCSCEPQCEYTSGCRIFEAFWHTLVAGKDESGKERCPPGWSMVFSLLLDAGTGAKYSLPDQEYDKRQELPDGHRGKVTVAHLGNWDENTLQNSQKAQAGEDISQSGQGHQQATESGKQKSKKRQKEGRKQGSDLGQRKLAKTFQDVQKATQHAMRNRCFGTTKRKHFGLFPKCTRVGDVICVFSGCHIPFVLRRHGEATTFQLVGECYVHGVMGGEVLDPESSLLEKLKFI